jgi:hypothetical protein
LIGWQEFESSLARFLKLQAAAQAPPARHKSHRQLQADKRRGRVFHDCDPGQPPLTASQVRAARARRPPKYRRPTGPQLHQAGCAPPAQEVGLSHRLQGAAAPPAYGIKSTDVTDGGEGRSLRAYYGMYL